MISEKREARLDQLLKKSTRILKFLDAGHMNHWRHKKQSIKIVKGELRRCVDAIIYHAKILEFSENEIELSVYEFEEVLK